ncbi:MAG: hypothetical protein GY714_23845 [Desulfobacterales bacterium]|nr:hypothetical protein [Desulfobacterales bacterium]
MIRKYDKSDIDSLLNIWLVASIKAHDFVNADFCKSKVDDMDFIYPGGLTLRPGVQKDIFFDTIKKNYPDLLHEFQRRYSNNLSSGSPVKSSTNELYNNLKHLSDKYQIPIEPPHYMYKDLYPVYDEIYILLNHMVSLYSANGTDTKFKKSFKCLFSIFR